MPKNQTDIRILARKDGLRLVRLAIGRELKSTTDPNGQQREVSHKQSL